jgi:hypothetical protein
MANPPPDDWPYRMALHFELTKPPPTPTPETVTCPACGVDELEALWERGDDELEPPQVCPSCLHLVGDDF